MFKFQDVYDILEEIERALSAALDALCEQIRGQTLCLTAFTRILCDC